MVDFNHRTGQIIKNKSPCNLYPEAKAQERYKLQGDFISFKYYYIKMLQTNSSIIRLATYTPLAEACDNECVTPLPSPIM